MNTSSLDHRRDRRSIDVFKKNIFEFTQKEQVWGIALRKDFCQRGKICSVEEHGVDNNGNIIEDRLPNHNVDKFYSFSNGNKKYIEIKTIPETCIYWTIKTSALEACIEQKAFILIPKSKFYWIFGWKTSLYFYKNFKHQIFPNFSPNDLAVRIYKPNIEQLENNKKIYKYDWLSDSIKFIKQNSKILLKNKL